MTRRLAWFRDSARSGARRERGCMGRRRSFFGLPAAMKLYEKRRYEQAARMLEGVRKILPPRGNSPPVLG